VAVYLLLGNRFNRLILLGDFRLIEYFRFAISSRFSRSVIMRSDTWELSKTTLVLVICLYDPPLFGGSTSKLQTGSELMPAIEVLFSGGTYFRAPVFNFLRSLCNKWN